MTYIFIIWNYVSVEVRKKSVKFFTLGSGPPPPYFPESVSGNQFIFSQY